MSGDSNGNSSGVRTTTTGANGGGGGSKKKGAAGTGNTTALSRKWKAPAGKAESEANAASLVRTLALSNFGDRPVFLEVRRHRSGHSQVSQGSGRSERRVLSSNKVSLVTRRRVEVLSLSVGLGDANPEGKVGGVMRTTTTMNFPAPCCCLPLGAAAGFLACIPLPCGSCFTTSRLASTDDTPHPQYFVPVRRCEERALCLRPWDD